MRSPSRPRRLMHVELAGDDDEGAPRVQMALTTQAVLPARTSTRSFSRTPLFLCPGIEALTVFIAPAPAPVPPPPRAIVPPPATPAAPAAPPVPAPPPAIGGGSGTTNARSGTISSEGGDDAGSGGGGEGEGEGEGEGGDGFGEEYRQYLEEECYREIGWARGWRADHAVGSAPVRIDGGGDEGEAGVERASTPRKCACAPEISREMEAEARRWPAHRAAFYDRHPACATRICTHLPCTTCHVMRCGTCAAAARMPRLYSRAHVAGIMSSRG